MEGVVSERYASALFEVAKRKGVQDQIESHLGLAAALFENDMLRRLLASPKVRNEEKMRILKRGLEGVVNPLVLNLLELLLEKKRVSYFPDIRSCYTGILEESKNIARAEVRTAIPLDAEVERKLTAALEKITGKHILLEKVVDRSLIGGVLVRIGDELLDSTIRTRLEDMREELLAAKVH